MKKTSLNNGWNTRLKEQREKLGLTFEQMAGSPTNPDYISRQSLIEYETNSALPKLDTLKLLCEKYGLSADYILFGKDNCSAPYLPPSDTLLCLFMLMYSKKISCDLKGNVILLDKKLKSNMVIMQQMIDSLDLSNYNEMKQLLDGLKYMAKENYSKDI